MNDVLAQEKLLLAEIEKFNADLSRHYTKLQGAHAAALPHWAGDDMQRDYDSKWTEVDATLATYMKRTGPEYVETLKRTIKALEDYLGGGR